MMVKEEEKRPRRGWYAIVRKCVGKCDLGIDEARELMRDRQESDFCKEER